MMKMGTTRRRNLPVLYFLNKFPSYIKAEDYKGRVDLHLERYIYIQYDLVAKVSREFRCT
jgi:hypothetical protein